MRFLAPRKEPSKVDEVQLSDNNFEKAYDEPSDSTVMDNGWIQTNDTDKFNNYTEEY